MVPPLSPFTPAINHQIRAVVVIQYAGGGGHTAAVLIIMTAAGIQYDGGGHTIYGCGHTMYLDGDHKSGGDTI
jgi:hypothetical protein